MYLKLLRLIFTQEIIEANIYIKNFLMQLAPPTKERQHN